MGFRTMSFVAAVALFAPRTAAATYSIIASDRARGEVGSGVTSCVGTSGVVRVYRLVPGHGGVNAQASANEAGRDRAAMLLGTDVAPADIIKMITAPSFDPNASVRQYGVVDLMGRVAGFTGTGAMNYKEDRQGTSGTYAYSVQGNILTGRAVIDQAEMAFRNTGCDLADKLMLALEAGAKNGEGDSRCTPRGIPSDASAIAVDRTGEPSGTYLKLSYASGGGTNAVTQLRTMFNAWRVSHPCPTGGSGGAGGASGSGGRGGGGVSGSGGAGAGGIGGHGGGGGSSGSGGTAGASGSGGRSGTGGSGDTGGRDGTGGRFGSGGTPGQGGRGGVPGAGGSGTGGNVGDGSGGNSIATGGSGIGTGGMTGGDAGHAGGAGRTDGGRDAATGGADDGGCTCRLAGSSDGTQGALLVMAAALLARTRRRRNGGASTQADR